MTKIRLCPTGKFAYVRLEDARSELASFQAKPKHRDGHAPKRPYRCPHCGFHHLTAQEKRSKR